MVKVCRTLGPTACLKKQDALVIQSNNSLGLMYIKLFTVKIASQMHKRCTFLLWKTAAIAASDISLAVSEARL